MEKNHGLFSIIRKQKQLGRGVSVLMMVSMVITPVTAFGAEEFFRQTKEDFTPHPFVQPDLSTGAFRYSQPVTVTPGRNGCCG